ncbi:MAG: winged helix-turn-helix domain-containing protein [Bacteroidaceae bacterium]|nr:winged helix-turn-helix domain-containing protein [Bacteroidaceae bacterium]
MDIGTNAGVIWRALNEERQGMTLDVLMSKVNLPLFEVAAAIGWLAREDKIGIAELEDGNLHLSVYHEYYY